jgi:RNA polymerase sigma-70 factor (sigma-E family)
VDEHARRQFGAFVADRAPALIRVAYLLCGGDQHAAEDLVQNALVKTAARWPTLRHEDPEGYIRTVMYREQVSRWRRSARGRELLVEPPREVLADQSAHVDLRLAMRAHLLRLPPAQRAVLVLRFFEDLTETQAAQVLGCSVGTVRSRTHRAVSRLRELLGDEHWLTEART